MIDTHAHLDFPDFQKDREEVISRAFGTAGRIKTFLLLFVCAFLLLGIRPASASGDFNSDYVVSEADFNLLKTDFLKLTADLTNPDFDLNGDGQVTVKDFGILMSNWGEVPQEVGFSVATGSVNKTDGTCTATVMLSRPADQTVTVDYATSDGTARSNNYGKGKNFTATSGTVTFDQGEISKDVTITIANNPIVDLDLDFTVNLSSPTNAALGTSAQTVTIVDDVRSGILDVPAPSGGNDTAAIQAVINQAHAAEGADKDNYVIRFQPGTYLVDRVAEPGCVFLYPGNTYTSSALGATTIKRLGNTPDYGSGERLFSTFTWLTRHNNRPLTISNLVFDGSHQVTDEQAALVFIGVGSGAGEQLNFVIQDCKFQENPAGDGLHVFTNVNAKVYKIDSYGVFRGSWSLTGGNTDVDIREFVTHNGDNDIEVDSYGYGNSYRLGLTAVDCSFERLNDIGMGPSTESNLSFTNCSSAALYNYQWNPGSTLAFNNCQFNLINTNDNKIYNPYNVTFNNSNFVRTIRDDELYPFCSPLVYTRLNPNATNETLTFNNCVFKTDGAAPSGKRIVGFHYNQGAGDDSSHNNRMIFNDCTFGSETRDINVAISSTSTKILYGGWIELHDSVINTNDIKFPAGEPYYGDESYPVYVTGKPDDGYFHLELDNVTFNTNKFLSINGNYSGNVIKIQDVSITKEQNVVSGSYYDVTFNSDNTIMRVITGAGAPGSADPCFCNSDVSKYDQYHDTTSGKYYKCTSMNPVTWTEYVP